MKNIKRKISLSRNIDNKSLNAFLSSYRKDEKKNRIQNNSK